MKKHTNSDCNLLDAVFAAIYWNAPSQKQRDDVLMIINNLIEDDCCSTSIANELCEYLRIEKRGNRSAIADVLFKMRNISVE